MFLVEPDRGGRDDGADASRATAVTAQRLEGRLQQRVGSLAETAQRAVDRVVGLLIDRQVPVFRLLERDREGLPFAFVAQVSQGEGRRR